ncbi:50S ribosomal protein L18Ae [Halobiforma nitratireducens]|uniref:Large ribosomal subunit protein eL20 n=1 Tax=Halobiforma nitratireducens JCM 10879 TaxID=1227454 RepID=M0MM61_9EURY|nr:50S ribosomal protein L18Ae [Halobiforma nitratireducens]EMA46458.1 50S ribosomal protein LX [Halobiforma nitratireducens JCM 10879]
MSQYTVTGQFKTRDGYAEFETTVDAENEDVAREHAFSQLGSQHGLKRTEIDLEGVDAQ